MKVLRIEGLPGTPLAAAAAFHAEWRDRACEEEGDTLLVFAPADHTHSSWRLAAVQELARSAAPRRINAVASGDAAAIEQARAYLAEAPGITGQYLPLN